LSGLDSTIENTLAARLAFTSTVTGCGGAAVQSTKWPLVHFRARKKRREKRRNTGREKK
jgi:hypothetical protein